MRLPRITQLTSDQKDVYLYASDDEHVLVQGPPGTGKTLIACLRAIELQKKGTPVVLGMFNAVLSRYASNAGNGLDLPSQTIQTWFRKWWLSSGLPPYNGPEGKVIIDLPYEDKDEVKALGATWDPKTWRPKAPRPGAWVMDIERYQSARASFPSSWKVFSDPPKLEGKSLVDWAAAASHVAEFDDEISDKALSLGTLLIDEGQDFSPHFYKMLRHLSAAGLARGRERVPHPLRCFVLADENQQLTDENSTLAQIAETLKVATKNSYQLLDNFRNSREIAVLAREFFNDVGALPRLPKRSSETPILLTVPDHASLAQRVRTWVVNNPGKEIAVFSFSESTRDALCRAIEKAVLSIRGRDIRVQTYSSKTWAQNKAKDLQFDAKDVVTILNLQSCKGLEFDAVFIADLHQAKMSQHAADRFRMQMFVAVSRARDSVTLVDSGPHAGTGDYVSYLPGDDVLERESMNGAQSKQGDGSRPPASKRTSVSARKSDIPDGWEAQLEALLKEKKLESKDRRSKGGSYWVFGGLELSDWLKPLGFQFSGRKGAWWRE